jgi:hypothetical protein
MHKILFRDPNPLLFFFLKSLQIKRMTRLWKRSQPDPNRLTCYRSFDPEKDQDFYHRLTSSVNQIFCLVGAGDSPMMGII